MHRSWKQFGFAPVWLAVTLSTPGFAGALYLEVGNPEAAAEAKAMGAILTARVTACHDPAKSVVTANIIQVTGNDARRTELKVRPLATPGFFAIVGDLPSGNSAIELAVTNPDYKNYEPRVLVHASPTGVQWASVSRFFGTPPTVADIKAAADWRP
jgi:hypothetical protein